MKTKFGDIICKDIPVLVCFYAQWNDYSLRFISTIREVAIVLMDRVEVFKFDVDENRGLVSALSVEALPTLMFYDNGVLLWRSEQYFTLDELLNKIHQSGCIKNEKK